MYEYGVTGDVGDVGVARGPTLIVVSANSWRGERKAGPMTGDIKTVGNGMLYNGGVGGHGRSWTNW